MTSPDGATSPDGLAVVLRHLERADRHDFDRAAASCAPDVRFYGPGARSLSRDEWKAAMLQLVTAFPDCHFAVEDMLADGDRVAVRHTLRGTHRGAFLGIPPTNRPVAISAMVVYRVADAQIAEGWWTADMLDLLRQLGAS